jgi:TPP-dependent pyruvate/acetoin dehydrogenase alpha subunit
VAKNASEASNDAASRTELGLDVLKRMLRVRRFEERAQALAAAGEFPGVVHLYIGQEAVAAGVCSALRADDFITSNHRGHGHVIAKGGEASRCMAELYGRATGYCGGKGGSMHMADMALGIIGANGIVGAGIPIATGAALSARLRGTDQVSVAFFGDGASNEGTFHESLNLAAIWNLPVIFVCENNGFQEFTLSADAVALGAVVQRADAYGIPGVSVDGNDAFAVHDAVAEAVERARSGLGPTLLEAHTYRMRSHAEGLELAFPDFQSREEVDAWAGRDPIVRHREALLADHVEAATLERIDAEAIAELDAAVEFARNSPEPDLSTAFTDVWKEVAV